MRKYVVIYAKCKTSVVSFENEKFPEFFAEIPKRGDLIRSISGRELMVVNITHLPCLHDDPNPILVELELSEVPVYDNKPYFKKG